MTIRSHHIETDGRAAFAVPRNNGARGRLSTDKKTRTSLPASRGNRRAVSSNKEGHCPMGLFTKDIKTMNDLFAHQLQDIYYAEKQLVKALPKMADKATDKQLKEGFLTHLEETKVHVQRLEQVFKGLGFEVKAVDCPAIDGIIEEAE
jgi:hypothetical protein